MKAMQINTMVVESKMVKIMAPHSLPDYKINA